MPVERIPPHSIEAEQSLLGALLIDKDALIRVADAVTPEDFYRSAHGEIWRSMLDLAAKREPIDLLSLANRLIEKNKLEEIGGRAYLIELTATVPTSAHVQHYAGIIHKKATLRRLVGIGGEISLLGFEEEEDVETVLDQAQQKLYGVSNKLLNSAFTPIKEALDTAFERIDELHRERGKLRGVPTGYTDLDHLLSGLQKSDLVILAARPSVGKTSLALDLARQAAVRYRVPVGIFSLEMSKDQLVDRLICSEAGVDLWRLRTGNLHDDAEHGDFQRIGQAIGALSEAPIYIDDSANMNVMEIRSKARRLQLDHGLGLIVVDYLQLMESRSGNRNSDNRVQEVAEITRGLKSLARELNVPVLALSQLSRAVEQSKPAIPKLSHLRESGSIEQDADVVMFIYRKAADKNYSIDEIPLNERYLAEIHIAKHRNGPCGMVKLFFDEQRVCFKNLEQRQDFVPAPALTQPSGKEPALSAPPMPKF